MLYGYVGRDRDILKIVIERRLEGDGRDRWCRVRLLEVVFGCFLLGID